MEPSAEAPEGGHALRIPKTRPARSCYSSAAGGRTLPPQRPVEEDKPAMKPKVQEPVSIIIIVGKIILLSNEFTIKDNIIKF